MSDGVEKSLVTGGILIALGTGGMLGFWPGVIVGGALLFSVALLAFILAMTVGGRG